MIKEVAYDFLYVIINYIIGYIPFWFIRKLLYKVCGMKVGKGSRINMRCHIFDPWGITIGENSIINEYCLLDGRGGLYIGDNCSISMYSIIYTASHKLIVMSFNIMKKRQELKTVSGLERGLLF